MNYKNLEQKKILKLEFATIPQESGKYNPIERRLFSHISINFKGLPLIDIKVAQNYIRNTTTKSGLKVKCVVDKKKYALGKKVPKDKFSKLKIICSKFHGEWNYKILPQNIF
jgi:hypothetical protein